MQWTSILAIYGLMWVLCAFIMLPFGVKTHEEAGMEKTAGQADSAPANFRPGRVALRATVLAAVLTAGFAVNYTQKWIGLEDIDVFGTIRQSRETE